MGEMPEGASAELVHVLRLIRDAQVLMTDSKNYDQAHGKLTEAKQKITRFPEKSTRTVRREIEALLRGIADTGEWTREELLGERIPPESED